MKSTLLSNPFQAEPDTFHSVENYEGDLQDSSLRGSTRAGIRHLLDAVNAMVEELENQRADLLMHSVDRDKVHAEYEKVLAWCK